MKVREISCISHFSWLDGSDLKTLLLIGLGSALGGMGRYGVSHWLAARFGDGFPLGTLAVNVVGSFVIGVFFYMTASEGRWMVDPDWRQFVLVGLCGGFTTFSTFSLQVMQQMRAGEWTAAMSNVLLSVFLCLLAVYVGMVCARWINQGGQL